MPQTTAGPFWSSPERLDTLYDALEAAAKAVPRDTFDPGVIANELSRDPQRLFVWVRDNTFWVPYRGALRGAAGVLMDRLGNSLDRSLLLAELLRASGHKVRLAHAALGQVQVQAILTQVRPLPKEAPASLASRHRTEDVSPEQISRQFGLDEAVVARGLAEASKSSADLSKELDRRVPSQSQRLLAAVGPPPSDSHPDSTASAADHWWVQRFDGSAWIDLDPTLPDAAPGTAAATAEASVDYDKADGTIPLPDAVVHRLGIRVVIQRWQGGELREAPALEYRLRPAEVTTTPIRLAFVPLQWPPDRQSGGGSPAAYVRSQHEWVPVLTMGSRQIAQWSFSDSGELSEFPKRNQDPKPAAQAFQQGLDALGGGGEAEPEEQAGGELTAAWIEYEISTPGDRPRTIRRELFDLSHAPSGTRGVRSPVLDEHSRGVRAAGLIGSIELLPMVSRLTPQFVEWELLQQATANRKALSRLVRNIDALDTAKVASEARELAPVQDSLLALGLGRFERSPVGNTVYLDRINLLSYRTQLSLSAKDELELSQGFDIIANEVAVRTDAGGAPFNARLVQGAMDTNAEALIVGGDTGNPGTLMGISNNSWVTVRSIGDAAWERTGWSAEARRKTHDALKDGYVVVVPSMPPGAAAAAPWWRVHPATGDTLGMGSRGWGQAMKEKVILTAYAVVIASIGGFAFGFILCMFAKDAAYIGGLSHPDDMKDCVCAGLATGAIFGAAAGGIVTGTTAGAALVEGSSFLKGFLIGGGVTYAVLGGIKEGLCVPPRHGARAGDGRAFPPHALPACAA